MTTLTTSVPATPRGFAPTALDRLLLALSRVLAETAQNRMHARHTRRMHNAARTSAREAGRRLHAEADFTLHVR